MFLDFVVPAYASTYACKPLYCRAQERLGNPSSIQDKEEDVAKILDAIGRYISRYD